ncbi:MAG: methyl-accepting chemotaxis protein [Gammaproteobacteria bacterium]|nr:methyl-accepting chemotaxis protein [Gammaproteobacteria bacterium]
MSNQSNLANMTPKVTALGALLLAGALALLFLGAGQFGESASSGSPAAGALSSARTAILAARTALDEGTPEAFGQLTESRTKLSSADTAGLSSAQIKTLQNLLTGLTTIENNATARESLNFARAELEFLVPQLEDASNALEQAAILQNKSVVVAQLERMRLLAGGLQLTIDGAIAGIMAPGEMSQQLLDKEMALTQIVKGFEKGDPSLGLRAVTDPAAVSALAALKTSAGGVSDNVRNVVSVSENLAALDAISGQLNSLAADLAVAPGTLSAGSAAAGPMFWILVGLVGLALLILVVAAWSSRQQDDARKDAERQTEQTRQNQAAIMLLLDELGSLADGDLTVKATVTEDITGAIADSINYAIEALRELVITLNDSAIRVDGAARQTDMTAQQLSAATTDQSKQIEAASQAILTMAASIEEISGNAERSSDVARHSVDVAHKGGDAVRRTIEGMNTIRETIQDTAKRIKRLGESSQEIGNIIELINDIADQTNILALNASIQASMAGEAGRGFAVVADEVQRLAERSANATKQIEVLVRTIQADTNEAVVSMERSNTDVVGGALLAENAGAALEEIEQVSNQIASLVQNISSSARGQSTAAAAVTRNVDMLQQINTRTDAGMNATTDSIRELTELAAQLRESVSGFRLPGDEFHEDDVSVADVPALDEDPADAQLVIKTKSDEIDFADQKTA